MDIFTTAVSTAVASITIVVTSFFGTAVMANETSNLPETSTSNISYIQEQVEQQMDKPIIMCGSGGLVPKNAPKCPTAQP